LLTKSDRKILKLDFSRICRTEIKLQTITYGAVAGLGDAITSPAGLFIASPAGLIASPAGLIASGAAVSAGFPHAANVAVKLSAAINESAFQFIISLSTLEG